MTTLLGQDFPSLQFSAQPIKLGIRISIQMVFNSGLRHNLNAVLNAVKQIIIIIIMFGQLQPNAKNAFQQNKRQSLS